MTDPGFGRMTPYLYGAVVLAVAVVFLLSFGSFLSPFLLFWVLVAVTMPIRGTPGHTALILVSGVLTLLWVLDTTGFLLAPFALALVLAYVLDPLVDRLSSGRLSRTAAIGLLALPLVGGLALLFLFGLPAMARQTAELIEGVPGAVERLTGWIEGWEGRILATDLPFIDESVLVEQVRAIDGESVMAFLRERYEVILAGAWTGVLGLGRGLGSVFSVLGYVVLTPVLTFYLLRDYDRVVARLGDLIPVQRRPGVIEFAKQYDHDLAAYLRGQFTVALMVGAITAIGLLLLRFPYAFLLGTTVAVLGLIPYAGLVLSLIPAVIIALLSGDPGMALIKVAVVFAAAQGLEGAVISPRIVGESVGLHPVWVVLALSVGGFFLGFLGLLIGVPVAVGVKLLVIRGVARYRESGLFLGPASEAG